MPTCDQPTIDANARIAGQINSGRNYYEIHVRILASDDTSKMITFTADNAKDANGGNTFTVRWNDPTIVWAACPSTLPSQAQGSTAGPVPQPNDSGTLYISIDYLKSHGVIATPPKWPKVQ
jgi:hypothetical protein